MRHRGADGRETLAGFGDRVAGIVDDSPTPIGTPRRVDGRDLHLPVSFRGQRVAAGAAPALAVARGDVRGSTCASPSASDRRRNSARVRGPSMQTRHRAHAVRRDGRREARRQGSRHRKAVHSPVARIRRGYPASRPSTRSSHRLAQISRHARRLTFDALKAACPEGGDDSEVTRSSRDDAERA